jgi:hypothetical protein
LLSDFSKKNNPAVVVDKAEAMIQIKLELMNCGTQINILKLKKL